MNWQRSVVPEDSRTSVQYGTLADLSSVFGMGTGIAPPLWPPDSLTITMKETKPRFLFGPL